MSKSGLVLMVAMLVAGTGGLAYARGGMGGGGGGGMDRGMSGGMSGSHMSSQGMANTNGPEAADRDKGLDRAEDRRNSAAESHERAAAPKPHRKHRNAEAAGERR